MQTVILAAGRGTRMQPLTDVMPKPMLPVGDRPLVDHVAGAAVAAGATELIFVTGYRGETVRAHFGDRYRDVPVTYVEQDEQRGTADAVRAAQPQLTGEHFAVVNGDLLVEPDALGPLYRSPPAVGATEVADPSAYGVLELDVDGSIANLVEKPDDPPTTLANAGAYTLPAAALDVLSDISRSSRGEYELTDVVNRLTGSYALTPVRFERWLDVGRPWELLEATAWKLEDLERSLAGTVSDGATLEGSVAVEPGATVREGVTIEGPAVIRSGAEVGPNAYVRGPAVIGEGARVGHAVEIKASVLFAGATVGHLSYVGDSVLGTNVNLGAGTTVATRGHDAAPVETTVKGERVSTGRRKYGAVVGPGTKTGIDTSINAGLVLPSGSRTGPGDVLLRQRDLTPE